MFFIKGGFVIVGGGDGVVGAVVSELVSEFVCYLFVYCLAGCCWCCCWFFSPLPTVVKRVSKLMGSGSSNSNSSCSFNNS